MKPHTGVKVRTVREMLNVSQQFVASKMGISQAAYSYLESGRSQIDSRKLSTIAKALNVKEDLIRKFSLSKAFSAILQQRQKTSYYRKPGLPSTPQRRKRQG